MTTAKRNEENILFHTNGQETIFQVGEKKFTHLEIITTNQNRSVMFGYRIVFKYKKLCYMEWMDEFTDINTEEGWIRKGIHLFYVNKKGFITDYENTSYCYLRGIENREITSNLLINNYSKI